MQNRAKTHLIDDYCGTTYAAKLLGLSVGTVQSLVERNELHAWKTQGGHRRISMPSIREYQRKLNMPQTSGDAGQPQLKVLAVDDDPIVLEMLREFALNCRFPVDLSTMSSGLEALIDIASIQPHVLIVDLNMPDVDGFEVLRKLRGNVQFDKMSCLAVSALTPEEIEARGGLPEGVVFMSKPLKTQWLNGFMVAILTTLQASKPKAIR
jgi:excisionase family DNA binding protein